MFYVSTEPIKNMWKALKEMFSENGKFEPGSMVLPGEFPIIKEAMSKGDLTIDAWKFGPDPHQPEDTCGCMATLLLDGEPLYFDLMKRDSEDDEPGIYDLMQLLLAPPVDRPP